MLAFFISVIVACVSPRAKLRSAAFTTAIVFALVGAFFGILGTYRTFDLRVLEQAGWSTIALVALTAAATSVAQVIVAFLVVWGFDASLARARKKAMKLTPQNHENRNLRRRRSNRYLSRHHHGRGPGGAEPGSFPVLRVSAENPQSATFV
jgi:hypothetical protein